MVVEVNNWYEIWKNKGIEGQVPDKNNLIETFIQLKKYDGFDMINYNNVDSFIEHYKSIKSIILSHFPEANSIYEIGCGSGAELYLFENDGFKTGGIDYSKNLLNIAKQVLLSDDLELSEAVNVPIYPTYDVVFSNSVFSYFSDIDYASKVLEKAYKKANLMIILADIFDTEEQNAYEKYREKVIPDYKNKYKNLDKLFYSKDYFINFAREHNMKIEFKKLPIKGYWNNDFVYNCFLYKN